MQGENEQSIISLSDGMSLKLKDDTMSLQCKDISKLRMSYKLFESDREWTMISIASHPGEFSIVRMQNQFTRYNREGIFCSMGANQSIKIQSISRISIYNKFYPI